MISDLAAHKIWVLFEAVPAAGPQTGAADDEVWTALAGPTAELDAWSAGHIKVSRDLAPVLAAALGADPSDALDRKIPVRRASRAIVEKLNGGAHSGQLTIRLGSSASKAESPLTIDEAFLVRPDANGSGTLALRTAVLVLRLGITAASKATIPVQRLLQVLHLLGHDSRKPPLHWSPSQATFRLSDLARALLAPLDLLVSDSSRLFTYTFSKLPDGICADDPPCLAFRLARHYDENYRVERPSVLQPFQDVWHATELEGAATVASGNVGLFAVDDPANAVQTTYLPQVIAAYYEHLVLLRLANSVVLSRGTGQRRLLRSLQEDHLLFRLRNSLPLVSQISLHNSFYGALGNGLGVPMLSRKVADDAAAVARVLEARDTEEAHLAANRRERRAAFLQGTLSGAVGFLTCLALIKEGGELAEKFAHGTLPIWQTASLVIAVAVAVTLGWLATARHRFEHGGGGRPDQARTEEEKEAINTVLEATAASSSTQH